MHYSNKEKRTFKSEDYVFRPTTLSEAMAKAGITRNLYLVREPKTEWPVKEGK